jgi:(S)-2-hydroxyglutarate dehydrogenase
MDRADVLVVGAGIVGLATARAVVRAHPGRSVVVIEKEASVAAHQSGHNSGVIHAGVYYQPGSSKASLCAAGRRSMIEYCKDHGIDHNVCGKVVVALADDDRRGLAELERRCAANGVRSEAVGPERLRELEPHVAGTAALHVLDTGIVDYAHVCRALAGEVEQAGTVIRLGCSVLSGSETASGLVVETSDGAIEAQRVVTCAGLHADPRFPFLGVHLTRGIDGHVHVGPNAVLAFAREGYTWSRVDVRDLRETFAFSGFRRFARRNWRFGLDEMTRSLSSRRFAAAVRRLVPEIERGDLGAAPSGVRAQAIGPDGELVDDFAIRSVGRAVHVLNAPSPAATASLEIGAVIAGRLS